MTRPPLVKLSGVKIVIKPDRYGIHYCFHIDPGDGSTVPIYIEANRQEKFSNTIKALKTDLVDIKVEERPWTFGETSGVKRYLRGIKESHERK